MSETLHIGESEITLTQALKVAGLAGTGGEAKLLIAAAKVMVNGAVELRKRKQLAIGDLVEIIDGGRLTIQS
jgi:ribosome-associated protein